jgi:F5/8 type C domain
MNTELIVPIEVHAFMANRKVRKFQMFTRWSPSFSLMLNKDFKSPGEPRPYENEEEITDSPKFEGIHVQWELPQALTTGFLHPNTGESQFPLVPNRWLIVRYCALNGQREVAGWVVQSDYLESVDHGLHEGSNSYLNLDAPAGQPKLDYLGRAHDLAAGAWSEPKSRPLFLTALGAGLPAFAAFAPYHKNVFLFHDTLEDLKPGPHTPAPDTDLSYTVIGWYSEDKADILVQAKDIPGLLPPDADDHGIGAVLAALGWTASGDLSAVVHTRYAGTALPVPWKREGEYPPSDRPDGASIKVAIGHSTADALGAMTTQQTRSTRTGDLIRALFQGNLHDLDTPDGPIDLEELTHRAWFSKREGGHIWHVVNRPSDEVNPQQPPPPQPSWVEQLNADQAAYDTAMPKLGYYQWRLWSLWWLHQLPENQRPPDFAFDPEVWQQEISHLCHAVAAQQSTVDALLKRIPHAKDPETLQKEIDEYARKEGLSKTLELKRSPRRDYYRPIDPAIVLANTGSTRPLSRDDALPCRLPSTLLTKLKINDHWITPDANPPTPTLDRLPPVCRTLIAEFDMLDQAARTPNALQAIVADPDTHTEGPFPEYTRVWRQPWLPMYLQWQIKYCATPYHSDDTEHWSFDGHRYCWNGTGAAAGDGEGGRRWTIFTGRSFLTPAITYVLREQLRRELTAAPNDIAEGLQTLREGLTKIEILSQSLDGFHDWLLHHDGTAQVTTDRSIVSWAGETNHVPDGAGDRRQQRFQPVRCSQFCFTDLRIIDRFGQVARMVTPEQHQYLQFQPIRAPSVIPDKPLYPEAPGPQRFLQLPPRLLQDTRLGFEPLYRSSDTHLAAAGHDTPVAGWLLVNHLDHNLLVYAPDGQPLGELRVISTATTSEIIAWNPLPHAPYRHPSHPDFAAAYPHLANFATALLDHTPPAFTDLMATIDQALHHISDPTPVEDRSPARLIGRPIALIRARLGIELLSPPLTDSAWDHALHPPPEDYPHYLWTVRLGDPDRLADGLIGYFAAHEPDQPTTYQQLHAVHPVHASEYTVPDEYVVPIGTGTSMRLPARPPDSPVTHYLTLLACPHTAIHATTDILPITDLTLDADVTHQALAAIRASFRLNPLLAPARTGGCTATTSLGHTPSHPPSLMLDGTLSTYYWSKNWATINHWVMLDLGATTQVSRVQAYLGRSEGGLTPPACVLEASTDIENWTTLAHYSHGPELHHHPAESFTARYLRLRLTNSQTSPIAIRQFEATTNPPISGVVMPRPAAWHGTWTWTEPITMGSDLPLWDELPLLACDDRAYPDDPLPTARTGYLQLHPTTHQQTEREKS